MLAIISDIHSNVEALTAVLDDLAERDVDQVVCLGDVIGYGPDPGPCLDVIRSRATATLMGNHDFAVVFEPNKFNIGAENACFWARQQLGDEPDEALRAQRWDFLGNLPMKSSMPGEPYGLGHITFSHGSPRRPINEYVFPEDIYSSPGKVYAVFERFQQVCFVGHTHVPGIFEESLEFHRPDEVDMVYAVNSGRKVMINVGSVGQPRDRDCRACYVLVGGGKVTFVRVAYDVESVVAKVHDIPELDDYLGNRLVSGR